jgi:transmembrane sensor
MTDSPAPSSRGGDQLSEEAALWFARMRGPDADAHRPAFEAWLARGAVHLAAYNRAAEIFAMGKFLAEEDDDAAPRPTDRGIVRRGSRLWLLVASTALVLLTLGAWLGFAQGRAIRSSARDGPVATPGTTAPLQLATRLGEITKTRLVDGSVVTLDADSLLTVAFDRFERRLRLERGRARFEVAHEARPFRVAAGAGTVTARGTIFEVRFAPSGKVEVSLLRGRVDVDLPRQAAGANAPGPVRLVPGQRIAFAAPDATVGTDRHVRSDRWADAMVEFDRAPLAEVIARANAQAAVKIRLSDPSLATLRVSGIFRITDGAGLADRLAKLFGLRADHRPDEVTLSFR